MGIVHFLYKQILFSGFTVIKPAWFLLSFIIMNALLLYIGSPKLHKNLIVRIVEGYANVTVDLLQGPAPFPEPSSFKWSKDGLPLPNNLSQTSTYSSVTFPSVRRNHAGSYTVSATNFLLDNSSRQLGSDTGNYYLDVLCKLLLLHAYKIVMRSLRVVVKCVYYMYVISRSTNICD